VREELRHYAEHAVGSGAPLIGDERQAERRIVAELSGFGPLQPLLDDPEIEEIWINGPTRVSSLVAGSRSSTRRIRRTRLGLVAGTRLRTAARRARAR
jgi:pilus assembly protein CpaF